MWRHNEIDYTQIVNFTYEKRYVPFKIQLYENGKIDGEIEIQREKIYDDYPIPMVIMIRNGSRLDFKIENYNGYYGNIENIHTGIENVGIGSLMFDIMYGYLLAKSKKDNFKIESITGTLSQHHHDSGDWLKSIPFYIKQAYRHDFVIEFTYGDTSTKLTKDSHPQYMNRENARVYAEFLMNETKTANFSINISKTSNEVPDQ